MEGTSSVWEEWFGRLESYVAESRNARPPAAYSDEDGNALGGWVSFQRTHRTKGRLSDERADRLESLPGWSWDPKEDEWNAYFDELVAYVEEHGTSRVDRRHVTTSGLKLGAWVSGTRTYRNKGMLREDRIKRLEALPGWVWSVR